MKVTKETNRGGKSFFLLMKTWSGVSSQRSKVLIKSTSAELLICVTVTPANDSTIITIKQPVSEPALWRREEPCKDTSCWGIFQSHYDTTCVLCILFYQMTRAVMLTWFHCWNSFFCIGIRVFFVFYHVAVEMNTELFDSEAVLCCLCWLITARLSHQSRCPPPPPIWPWL